MDHEDEEEAGMMMMKPLPRRSWCSCCSGYSLCGIVSTIIVVFLFVILVGPALYSAHHKAMADLLISRQVQDHMTRDEKLQAIICKHTNFPGIPEEMRHDAYHRCMHHTDVDPTAPSISSEIRDNQEKSSYSTKLTDEFLRIMISNYGSRIFTAICGDECNHIVRGYIEEGLALMRYGLSWQTVLIVSLVLVLFIMLVSKCHHCSKAKDKGTFQKKLADYLLARNAAVYKKKKMDSIVTSDMSGSKAPLPKNPSVASRSDFSSMSPYTLADGDKHHVKNA